MGDYSKRVLGGGLQLVCPNRSQSFILIGKPERGCAALNVQKWFRFPHGIWKNNDAYTVNPFDSEERGQAFPWLHEAPKLNCVANHPPLYLMSRRISNPLLPFHTYMYIHKKRQKTKQENATSHTALPAQYAAIQRR